MPFNIWNQVRRTPIWAQALHALNCVPPLSIEMMRARTTGIKTLLAGVELLEISGVTGLTEPQIEREHHALRTSDIDGLVLSWELWHMPLVRLQQVARLWGV